MNFISRWFVRWQLRRAAHREAALRAFANSHPSFEWIIVRAGTAEKTRSPMLTTAEIRPWFREEFPNGRICQMDLDNKIVFYE